MTPDDARAALDAACACPHEHGDCPCVANTRAAVWPIIETIMEESRHWEALFKTHKEMLTQTENMLAQAQNEVSDLKAKLAAAEAERDHWAECNTEWAETATKHAVHIADLEEKLAQAETLLQRLAAAEAERDKLSDQLFEAERNCEAWKTVGDNIGKQRAELREKLAQAEALLQKRPHIVVVETTPQAVFEQAHGFTFRTFHEEDTCIRWGGACAK